MPDDASNGWALTEDDARLRPSARRLGSREGDQGVAIEPRGLVSAMVVDLAPQDWLVIAYFTLLFVGVLFGAGPHREEAGLRVIEHAVVLALGLALTRGGILRRQGFASALVYRLTLFATVVSSYFALRIILPAAAPRVVDATLYAIDRRVFHYEPALAWDRFVSPSTTEWFAFFYFSYFVLLAAHVLPFMFFGTNMAVLARFAMATFLTFCGGQLLYIVVPGYGPHWFLANQFEHPLSGGVFWGLVKATIADAGAEKDIFPSLHTAVPTMFTLLAFRLRAASRPFRLSWLPMALWTSQIILATMFLRWHYLIDICAGLLLAVLSVTIADRAIGWDEARRARLHLAPAWTPLFRSASGSR